MKSIFLVTCLCIANLISIFMHHCSFYNPAYIILNLLFKIYYFKIIIYVLYKKYQNISFERYFSTCFMATKIMWKTAVRTKYVSYKILWQRRNFRFLNGPVQFRRVVDSFFIICYQEKTWLKKDVFSNIGSNIFVKSSEIIYKTTFRKWVLSICGIDEYKKSIWTFYFELP